MSDSEHDVEIGDQVESGRYGTEDHDVGEVISVDRDIAVVRWSGGNTTKTDARELDFPPACARCGRQQYHLDQCSHCGLADARAQP